MKNHEILITIIYKKDTYKLKFSEKIISTFLEKSSRFRENTLTILILILIFENGLSNLMNGQSPLLLNALILRSFRH